MSGKTKSKGASADVKSLGGLLQAEAMYHDIFENASEGIFQSTPAGRFININPALARLYGYASPEEMITTVTDITHQSMLIPKRALSSSSN
jgi:PAS domain-containing protein